jgi:hydrogenase maturation protease
MLKKDRIIDSSGRTLILGLGNPLLTDDSVGLRVARRLRSRLANSCAVDVEEDYWGGLRCMERMVGYDRAIIVDAICTGAEAGNVQVLSLEDLPTRHSGSSHDVNLGTALELGRQAGAHLPEAGNIRIVAIEAVDVMTFDEQCTPAVEAGIERAVAKTLAILSEWIPPRLGLMTRQDTPGIPLMKHSSPVES